MVNASSQNVRRASVALSDLDGTGVSQKALDLVTRLVSGPNRRTYFGSSGASLTHQVNDAAFAEKHHVNVDKGASSLKGTRDVTTFLKKWLADKPNTVLIDCVSWPGSDPVSYRDDEVADEDAGYIPLSQETDHVVLVGSDMWLIDDLVAKDKKNFSIAPQETDSYDREIGSQLLMSGHPFWASDLRAREAYRPWVNDIRDPNINIFTDVVIDNHEIHIDKFLPWYNAPYRAVGIDDYDDFLTTRWEETDDEMKSCVNPFTVAQVVAHCVKPYDPYKNFLSSQALKSFQ